jgi:hypothetical protein
MKKSEGTVEKRLGGGLLAVSTLAVGLLTVAVHKP